MAHSEDMVRLSVHMFAMQCLIPLFADVVPVETTLAIWDLLFDLNVTGDNMMHGQPVAGNGSAADHPDEARHYGSAVPVLAFLALVMACDGAIRAAPPGQLRGVVSRELAAVGPLRFKAAFRETVRRIPPTRVQQMRDDAKNELAKTWLQPRAVDQLLRSPAEMLFGAAELRLYQESFRAATGNGDHDLTFPQFEAVLSTLFKGLPLTRGKTMAKGLFRLADRDGSGVVDFRELMCLLSTLCRGADTERMAVCFAAYDLDGSGSLEASEAQALVRAVLVAKGADDNAIAEADSKSAATLQLLDSNNDGKISFDEFRHGVAADTDLMRAFGFGGATQGAHGTQGTQERASAESEGKGVDHMGGGEGETKEETKEATNEATPSRPAMDVPDVGAALRGAASQRDNPTWEVELKHRPAKAGGHTVYDVAIHCEDRVCRVEKRYRAFDELHWAIRSAAPTIVGKWPTLPPKKWFWNMDATFVHKRAALLRAYVERLFGMGSAVTSLLAFRAFFPMTWVHEEEEPSLSETSPSKKKNVAFYGDSDDDDGDDDDDGEEAEGVEKVAEVAEIKKMVEKSTPVDQPGLAVETEAVSEQQQNVAALQPPAQTAQPEVDTDDNTSTILETEEGDDEPLDVEMIDCVQCGCSTGASEIDAMWLDRDMASMVEAKSRGVRLGVAFARQVFKDADKGKDGSLSKSEIRKYFKAHPIEKSHILGPDFTWKAFFASMDKDGDNAFDIDEFTEAVSMVYHVQRVAESKAAEEELEQALHETGDDMGVRCPSCHAVCLEMALRIQCAYRARVARRHVASLRGLGESEHAQKEEAEEAKKEGEQAALGEGAAKTKTKKKNKKKKKKSKSKNAFYDE